jgi:hypothetical protein
MRYLAGCPLWVISGQSIAGQNQILSALVQKRTNAGTSGLSALCQSRHSLQRSKAAGYFAVSLKLP